MERTTISLDSELHSRLKAIAQERGVSVATVIREMLAVGCTTRPRRFLSPGIGKSERPLTEEEADGTGTTCVMALVLDTGVLYAALNQTEPEHLRCRRLVEETTEDVVIPAPVLPEVDYFITTHMHVGVLLSLLRDIQLGNFHVASVEPQDYSRIDEIVTQHADAKVGFVDAAVLAIVERLNEPKLATLDRRHFAMLRPRHVDALTLLP